MDYKKKYEDALERCKKEFNFSNLAYSHEEIKERLEHVFPELKESEDERIRKEIARYFKNYSGGDGISVKFPKWITWLEKQGERKQNVTDIDIISDLENYFATTTKEQQEKDWDEIKNWEEKHFNHNKHIEQKPNFCHHEVDLSNCSEEYRKAYYDGWNNCNQQHAQLKAEQKPAWSEDDEEIIEGLNNCLDELEEKNGWRYTYVNDKDVELDKIRNWLKSLKERMKGE